MIYLLFLEKKVDLNPTEMNIYHYINANLNKVVYMRIKELADATHVSTATILRLCRKFGFQGFPEFKLNLQYYLDNSKNNQTSIQTYDESIYVDFLIKSTTHDFRSKILEASQILSNSEFLFFAGYGTSALMAEYTTKLFSTINSFSFAIKDPTNYPIYTFPDYLSEKLCLVVFSVSGENEEILELMSRFRVHEVKIISITNTSLSNIAILSDINIPYYINEEMYQDSNITSQLPVISIIEDLARETFKIKKQNNI